jgi:hypothetical protein
MPSPSPSPDATALTAEADRIGALVGTRRASSSSYGSLVVEKLSGFPFEKIADFQPGENAGLSSGEERVLCRFLFEVDKDNNTKSAGLVTFHRDGQGRIVRVNEYDGDKLLSSVHVIEYGAGAEPVRVTSYDRDGNVLPAE